MLAGAVLVVFLATAIVVDRFGQVERAAAAPVIVVLGARVLDGGVASNPLRSRVEKAVALYRHGVAPRILFSGGLGDHGPAEAVAARAIAIEQGVPMEACLVEDQSHSTAENAALSARILASLGIHRVILVSDPYHLLRAQQYFHREGIAVLTSPALGSERNVHGAPRLYWTLREAIALLVHPRLPMVRRPPDHPTTE